MSSKDSHDNAAAPKSPGQGPPAAAAGDQGPTRLPPDITEVTAPAMYAAMSRVWISVFGSQPRRNSLLVILAQWALETGRGKDMRAYNVGNIKSVEGDGHDYTFFACSEIINGKEVSYYPDFPGSRFRAYSSLELGVSDYLRFIHDHFASAWSAVIAGKPRDYSRKLKQANYYTANEASYTKSLVSLYNEFSRSVGIDPRTIDVSTPLGVEQALLALGYDPGRIDGKPGSRPSEAICKFQQARGLKVDGVAGPDTKSALAMALAALPKQARQP